jgi:hypothetical protein
MIELPLALEANTPVLSTLPVWAQTLIALLTTVASLYTAYHAEQRKARTRRLRRRRFDTSRETKARK